MFYISEVEALLLVADPKAEK